MQIHDGRVSELTLDSMGQKAVWITCPAGSIPRPGQYLLAWSPEDVDAALATPLYATETSGVGFLSTPHIPRTWEPGTELSLHGPLGHGFSLPEGTQHLVLVALGESVHRLLLLMRHSLTRNLSVALFTDADYPSVPMALEVHPLRNLPEALSWADLLCIDLPLESLASLTQIIGDGAARPACPVQVLAHTPVPCGGLADCGVCAVAGRKSWKLACKDGPVFNLQELDL